MFGLIDTEKVHRRTISFRAGDDCIVSPRGNRSAALAYTATTPTHPEVGAGWRGARRTLYGLSFVGCVMSEAGSSIAEWYTTRRSIRRLQTALTGHGWRAAGRSRDAWLWWWHGGTDPEAHLHLPPLATHYRPASLTPNIRHYLFHISKQTN